MGGWREAQRKGWQMLSQRLGGGGGALPSDSTLDSIVSGIVVEDEQIGPNRYIARLGVLFNRGKRRRNCSASAGRSLRSSPMLLIPVQWSGGAAQAFETAHRMAEGLGALPHRQQRDRLCPPDRAPAPIRCCSTQAQIGRPGPRLVAQLLDQYAAADVLIPRVTITRGNGPAAR